jgi:hypothetical protein
VVERLQAAAEASVDLAQSYVDLRRLDRSSIPPRRECIDVGGLLEELGYLARRRIGPRQLSLRSHSTLEQGCLWSDAEKLHALLAHLLMDVIEHTPAGEIRLDARPHPGGGALFLVGPRCPAPPEPAPPGPASIAVAIAHRLSRLIEATLDLDPAGRFFVVRLPAAPAGTETREHHLLQ